MNVSARPGCSPSCRDIGDLEARLAEGLVPLGEPGGWWMRYLLPSHDGSRGSAERSKLVEGRAWADQTAAHSSVSTWVSRDRETCFDYVADFSRHSEWTTNPVQITPVDDGGNGVSARFRAVGHQAGKEWPSPGGDHLRPAVDLRVHSYRGAEAPPADDPHRHTFTFAAEEGGTRIVLVRRDPLPPDWSRAKRALAPLIVRLSLSTQADDRQYETAAHGRAERLTERCLTTKVRDVNEVA